MVGAARDRGADRWLAYLEPLPDAPPRRRASATSARWRCGPGPRTGRRTRSATRCPTTVTEPFLDAIDRLLKQLARREVTERLA